MAVCLGSDFLIEKYGAENVKFLGAGSDSAAYKVGDRVFRFTARNIRIYQREADICNFLRKYISYEIPNIQVAKTGKLFYAEHKMLTGKKWSWHTFSFQPRRQRNLARTLAEFLAQLHSANVDAAMRAVPDLNSDIPYIDFDTVAPILSRFMGPRTLKFFRRHYEEIINRPIKKSDMVMVHLGVKGANSVCYTDGRLKGVFDFGNCGIYERSRDFLMFSLARNRRLYRDILKYYYQYSGVKLSRDRIRELSRIEFLWSKRWIINGELVMMNKHFLKRQIADALLLFWGVPRFAVRHLVYWWLSAYERRHAQ